MRQFTAVLFTISLLVLSVSCRGVDLRYVKYDDYEKSGDLHASEDLSYSMFRKTERDGSSYETKVCLLLSDGPSPLSIDNVLRQLKKAEVRATFFIDTLQLQGNKKDEYFKDHLVKIRGDGHTIGLRFDPRIKDLKSMSGDYLKKSLARQINDILNALEYRVQVVIFPYDGYGQNAVDIAKKNGLYVIEPDKCIHDVNKANIDSLLEEGKDGISTLSINSYDKGLEKGDALYNFINKSKNDGCRFMTMLDYSKSIKTNNINRRSASDGAQSLEKKQEDYSLNKKNSSKKDRNKKKNSHKKR